MYAGVMLVYWQLLVRNMQLAVNVVVCVCAWWCRWWCLCVWVV